MNSRIKELREYILSKKHHAFRRDAEDSGLDTLCEDFRARNLPAQRRASAALRAFLEAETPVILPGEKIVLTRTIKSTPEIFCPNEWEEIKKSHFIHERGDVCNISADYRTALKDGLGAISDSIHKKLSSGGLDESQRDFLESAAECVDSLRSFILKYADHARDMGMEDIESVLRNISSNPAKSLREALQLLRALHFSLWASGNYHNTLGRFDQYIFPYYEADIKSGAITKEEAFDLIEEFFLACNKDSDLYPGMQQGDNGQSMVLAGRDENGNYLFNEVSDMCLRASYELKLIDPKINLRVDSKTPLEIYEKGSELTKIGLGFPQYSNDDIVVPSLIEKGYSPEDARNYVVAACWEFIVPECALDIPNIGAVSLAEAMRDCVKDLPTCRSFEDFYALFEAELRRRADLFEKGLKNIYIKPAPMMSAISRGCIESARDISHGLKYNNYGVHGTGIATAVDSLAAIKKYVFEEKSLTPERLIRAIETDFKGEEDLKKTLRTKSPKMGQDDDFADDIAKRVLASFAESLKGRVNERGGIFRAGTGTAMFYIFHSKGLGATPDGRGAGEVIPANYSPSLFIKQSGPMSVVKSFSKPKLKDVANGGPLTLEFDKGIFRNGESVQKLAMLVRTFILLGGHQLQLNAVGLDELLEAKKHPELYRHLIVRVWGWSGYFVELDECYQDHVIHRIEFGL